MDIKTEWVHCPFCHSKTRIQIREDTVLVNFPLFCPKCKHIALRRRANKLVRSLT